jgi:hypothetical protein
MKKYEVKVYHAVIRGEDGVEYAVDIGVVQSGVPFDAYWDSWIDPRIYFNVTAQEMEALEVGSQVADGDTLVEIDKANPSIWEAEYDEDAYSQSMEVF